jgi:hypothetical protein
MGVAMRFPSLSQELGSARQIPGFNQATKGCALPLIDFTSLVNA